jgi:hypothetical protein
MHQFEEDPFRVRGRTNVMVKHFAREWPKPKCHEREHARQYTTDEIVMTFGFRGELRHGTDCSLIPWPSTYNQHPPTVVDNEGANVTAEWVESSNERLTSRADRGRASKGRQAKGKRKAPATPPAPPPAPPASRPPVVYEPSSRGGSALRGRLRQEQAPAWSSGSGASASTARFEIAGSSESTGSVPVADMIDYSELWSAQVGGTGYYSWSQPGEGGDMPPVCLTSSLVTTGW